MNTKNIVLKAPYILVLLILFSKSFAQIAQTDSVNVYDLDLAQLSKIQIESATKTAQNIKEIPTTINIITASEILERGYFTLDEALSDLPGFQFRNIQGFNSYVFQRGIPSRNNLILILIDGVQVNELNSGGFYGGGLYNLSNVERIEIIYGPASVAYGTNAVSGVINLITKSALEEKISVKSLVGSFNTSENNATYCYTNDDKSFGILFSGMIKKTDKANLKGGVGDYNWTDLMDNYENDYSFDLKIQTGDLTIGTNYLNKKSSYTTAYKAVGTSYKDYGTCWNIQFINNYIKYKSNINNKLSFSSILYNRNSTVLDNTIYRIDDTTQVGYYRPNNLTGFETVFVYDANNFLSITSGITLEYEQLAKSVSYSYSNSPIQKPPTPKKPPMACNTLASYFIEPQIYLFEKLFIAGGLRVDQSSVYKNVVTPRAGITYHNGNHIFRTSYTEAFRAPKPWDYTDGVGNASLLPEKMKSFETSATLYIYKNFSIKLDGYVNNLHNAIFKEYVDSVRYRWINKGEINTNGFELCLTHVLPKLKLSVNYTFNESYNEHGSFVPEISKHCGNAIATYSINNFIKINLRANYIGKRENTKIIKTTNNSFVDSYVILHGALSVLNYKGFNFQIMVNNILDKEYYHTSDREPDRYRQPQRTIRFSVEYSL